METTTPDRSPFTRSVRVAKMKDARRGALNTDVFAFVKWDGSRLSITGVEGPDSRGECEGGCGQIMLRRDDHKDHIPEYDRLAEVWDRWHLNDMRAGCVHQMAEGWGSEKIEVATYNLTSEAWAERRALEQKGQRALLAGEAFQYTPDELAIVNLPLTTNQAPDADSVGSGRYQVKDRTEKWSGHVYPVEHPRGVLTKACPVCGHQYGTAWLFEEVPTDVLDFLRSLPQTNAPGSWGP